MDLDRRDLRELAAFFAKRFPTQEAWNRLASQTGVALPEVDDTTKGPAEDAWLQVLVAAEAQTRLSRLARLAGRTDPGDENLQDVCGLLAPPRSHAPVILGALAAAIALVSIVGIAGIGLTVSLTGTEPAVAVATVDSGTPRPDLVSTASGVASGGIAPAPSPPHAQKADLVSASLAAAAVDDATHAPESTPEAPSSRPIPAARLANVSGRCTAGPGEVVGYWYAGSTPPGSSGQTIEMDYSVYVRADYPDTHNGYDARTAVRCALKVGDRVTLSQTRIAVPGGAFWVPLVTGDLQQG